MFTGLVQDVGQVERLHEGPVTDLWIRTALPAAEFALGESIAIDGCCLTVVEREAGRFRVQAAPETLRRTTLSGYRPGTRVNLERALRLADRLGGHLVLGHVDAVADVLERRPEGGSVVYRFSLPRVLAPLFIEKGSAAVDGVSLTVNALDAESFSVQLIPETQARTALADKAVGAKVNLEADVVGKYLARLASPALKGLSAEAIAKAGFFGG